MQIVSKRDRQLQRDIWKVRKRRRGVNKWMDTGTYAYRGYYIITRKRYI